MKKILIIAALIFVLLSLCSCYGTKDIYTVNIGDETYTIDKNNSTVSDEKNTYQYSISGTGEGYTITLTYPNGVKYVFQKQTDGFTTGLGGLEGEYDDSVFSNGVNICKALEKEAPKTKSNFGWFGTLLLTGIGVFNVCFPKVSLDLAHGWLFKNAEPTTFALNMYRISGVLCLIIALVLIFV